MNTIPGLRPLDLPLVAGQAPTWPAPSTPAASGHAPRWLDGLAGGTSPTIGADVPRDASGLGAAAHAERVLAALLG